MPMVPELAIAMLACARIGAVHSVIFGGFSAEAIADRNNDAKAQSCVITADGGWRRGKLLPLKANVDEALAKSPTVEQCIVLQPRPASKSHDASRAAIIWWHELMAKASADCPAEPLDSEAPLFILYTSGSTGKPKGIKHTTAGYNLFVKKTFEWVFDHRDEDIFWCTADIGWVTGHSYVVYGPLSAGATMLMYEGAPNWPDERPLLGASSRSTRHDFLHRADGDSRVHQMGRPACRQARSVEPAAAGHGRRRDQSRSLDVVSPQDRRRALPDRRYLVADRNGRHHDEPAARRDCRPSPAVAPSRCRASCRRSSIDSGKPVAAGTRAAWLVITQALARHAPRHLGRRRPLSRSSIGARCRGKYLAGDNARCDDDGYYWIMGRIDDVLNVAGHRLSTIEIESRPGQPSERRRSRRRGPAGRDQGRGRRRVRHAQERRAERRPAEGAASSTSARRSARWPQPDDIRFTSAAAQNAQRQNHAAAAARHRRRQGASRRHEHAGRLCGLAKLREEEE